ncbi:MAG TPA: radical SAM protein [Polyangia bacterium]
MNWHPLARVERTPRTCIWEITGACNLRCIHCENNCGPRSPQELSLDEFRRVAEGLAGLGCRHAHITGGEPLLRSDWDLCCRALTDLGIRVALVTNGTLLDEEALDRAQAAGVSAVGISIDGLREVHDSIRLRPQPGPSPWDQTLDALDRSCKRLETIVITHVNQRNLGQLPALRDLLRQMGVRRWQIQLAIPVGRLLQIKGPYLIAPADLESLTSFIGQANDDGLTPAIDTSDSIGYYTEKEILLRKRTTGQGLWIGCQAGIRLVAITYEGKVRGCSALPQEFDAGDLRQESIEDIWKDEERFAYATRFNVAKLAGGCAGCEMGPLCRAGCTTMAYWMGGTIYDNPYCLPRVRKATSCQR